MRHFKQAVDYNTLGVTIYPSSPYSNLPPVLTTSHISTSYQWYTTTATTWDPTTTKEKDMFDQEALIDLNAMRIARDKAAQYREKLNDEAFQLELQAQSKRALASYMTTEINEGVPVADDEVVNAVTTTSKATAASK